MKEHLQAIQQSIGRKPKITHLIALVAEIRPKKGEQPKAAIRRVEELIEILENSAELAAAFHVYIWALFQSKNQLKLYTDAGILSNRPFLTETWQKFQYKMLPPLPEMGELSSLIAQVFNRKTDYKWVEAVPLVLWRQLLWGTRIAEALPMHSHHIVVNEAEEISDAPLAEALPLNQNRQELLNAIVVLTQRITTMGMEPEIVSKLEDVDDLNSPFMRLNAQVMYYTAQIQAQPAADGYDEQAYRNALALIRRCEQKLMTLRRKREIYGVSLTLTHLVKRLEQHNHRLKALFLLLLHPDAEKRQEQIVRLFREFVRAENTKFSLIAHLSASSSLLAYQVLENTSNRGENYAISSRKEYAQIFRAALGGGFIVAWLCCFKLKAGLIDISPFGKAFLYSMNYAIGFMLIHIFRFTLATKQPAVTASTIAETLDKKRGRRGLSVSDSVALIRRITQAQTVSLLGNVLMAFPIAFLLATLYHALFGSHIAPTAAKAEHMIADLHPFTSLSLLHAAFAGVFLMTSGLISGFYDNKVVYGNIPARLRQIRILRRIFPHRWLLRGIGYIERNLGALAGNFYLGIFLGSLGMIGQLFGLPLDIRHITFAAGNFGLAFVSLDHHLPASTIEMTALGVLLIGIVNVLVSFGLSITIALKSRSIEARHAHAFFFAILRDFIRHPLSYILPVSRK